MSYKNYKQDREENREVRKEEKVLDELRKIIANSDHYSGAIETIEFIKDKLTDEQFEGFLLGNAIKYISGANKKDDKKKDRQKALIYLFWANQEIGEKNLDNIPF